MRSIKMRGLVTAPERASLVCPVDKESALRGAQAGRGTYCGSGGSEGGHLLTRYVPSLGSAAENNFGGEKIV